MTLAHLFAPATASAQALSLSPWKGEFFTDKQGGLYVKIQALPLVPGMRNEFLENIDVTVQNLLTSEFYTFTQKATRPIDPPQVQWKLPAGKYRVTKIQAYEKNGMVRRWIKEITGKNAKPFVVSRQCLSNLGVWTLKPVSAAFLDARFEPQANSYKEIGNKSDSAIAAIIDGWSGAIQERFAGKDRLETGKVQNHSRNDEARIVATSTRTIKMFFKLDLFRHNRFSKETAAIIDAGANDLRECYKKGLDKDAQMRGDMQLSLLFSKETGTIKKVRASGGSITDPPVIKCVSDALMGMRFTARENMVGQLTYNFEVEY